MSSQSVEQSSKTSAPEQSKPLKAKLFSWTKDIVIMGVVISALFAWQGRNLLDDDGTVVIPEQNFVTLQGDVFSLQKSNKKTVMYFFAPWCSICRYSISNLSIIDESEYNVVRVALDYSSTEEVQQFIDGVGVSGTVLMGNNVHKDVFNINAYPTYYVLDEALQVVANDMGYSSTLGIKMRTSF